MDQDPKWKNSRLMPYAIGVADALRGIVGDKLERLQLPQKLTDKSSHPAAST
jgi:hypothetical protein